MKKIAFIFCLLASSLSLAVNCAYASPEIYSKKQKSEMEQEMYDLGVVDDSGKYKDIELAGKYFRVIAETTSASLPVKVNKDIEILSIFVTPYYSNYSYRVSRSLDDSERVLVASKMLSEESIAESCRDIFNERVYRVNNHTIELNYMDADSKKLVTVTLNNRTCPTQ